MISPTSKLIEIIKKDIYHFHELILENEPRVTHVFSEMKEGENLLTISFSYFIELLNKYCFNFEGFPFKNKNFDFLGGRFDLFYKVFISNENVNLSDQIIFYYFKMATTFNKPIVIFYLLYYAIFIEYFLSSKDISIIFTDLYSQWKSSFREQKIPLKFITTLPTISIKDEFNITENIHIKDILAHFRVEKRSEQDLESSYYMLKFIDDDFDFDYDDNLDLVGTCLIYNTDLSFAYFVRNNKKIVSDLKKEFDKKIDDFTQIINTFYLLGFDFKYKGYFIELPWWYIPPTNKYRKFESGFPWGNIIENDKKKEFLDLYKNVVRSEIFVSNKYEMIMNRYHQIFNRDSYPDIILDTFIILEWLFTRDMFAELSYRLSLNAAMFISSDWKEFKLIQKFLKDLYGLTSKIIHGGHWVEEGNKILKKYDLEKPNDLIKKLKSILNKCIIRLINLIITESNILDKFGDQHFFFERSNVFKDL